MLINRRNGLLYLLLLLLMSLECIHGSKLVVDKIVDDDSEDQHLRSTFLTHSTLETTTNSTSDLQNLLLLRLIMRAVKLAAAQQNNNQTAGAVKIYGSSGGVEHKFPPFLERIVQRIQTYFSVYRYSDTSQPWNTATTTTADTIIRGETESTTNHEDDMTTTTITYPTVNDLLDSDYFYIDPTTTALVEHVDEEKTIATTTTITALDNNMKKD